MLSAETPYPQVGSYALLIDEDQPLGRQSAELVRIQRAPLATTAPHHVLVSFPLRDGASGNKGVLLASLIDATPLTDAEAKDLVELGRELARLRVSKRAAKEARRDALHSRAMWAPHMLRLLDRAMQKRAA